VSGRNGHSPQPAAPREDVLLGYLCSNEVSQSFHRSFLDLVGWDLGNGGRLREWAAVRTGPLQLPESRNKLAQQAIDTGAEWLLMIDSDMGFGPDTLERLLAAADPVERPVVGALCFANRELRSDGMGGMFTFPAPTILMWRLNDDGVFRYTGIDHYPVNSLIRVGATGGACILIHRSALERVAERFGPCWFDRATDTGGGLMGEDISFCWRLQQLDVPVFMHTGIRTTHYKAIWLAESDFWQSRIAPPAVETVDVIVPVLHRPENVPTLVRSLRASTGLARAVFVVEPDDEVEAEAVQAEGGWVIRHAGTFAQKVNAAFPQLDAPWALLVGDDVRFRPGWLDQALDVAGRYGADVVGTNDLLNPRVIRGEHATHPLIRRSYVDRVGASWDGPGAVCHEGYRHWFVDDEIVMAAQLRGVFQAALGSHVEHLHRGGEPEGVDEDRDLFQRRLRAAFKAPSQAAAGRRVLVATG
jgi:GT2 family glycosyltransferase